MEEKVRILTTKDWHGGDSHEFVASVVQAIEHASNFGEAKIVVLTKKGGKDLDLEAMISSKIASFRKFLLPGGQHLAKWIPDTDYVMVRILAKKLSEPN